MELLVCLLRLELEIIFIVIEFLFMDKSFIFFVVMFVKIIWWEGMIVKLWVLVYLGVLFFNSNLGEEWDWGKCCWFLLYLNDMMLFESWLDDDMYIWLFNGVIL